MREVIAAVVSGAIGVLAIVRDARRTIESVILISGRERLVRDADFLASLRLHLLNEITVTVVSVERYVSFRISDLYYAAHPVVLHQCAIEIVLNLAHFAVVAVIDCAQRNSAVARRERAFD